MIQYPLQLAGARTRVLEAGQGPSTVVFLHGMGARADRWKNNLPAFAAAHYRACALDFPGHGFADKGSDQDYTVPGLAAFVQAFLQQENIRSPILIGTSIGGHVIAHLVTRGALAPEAVVLVGSLGLVPLPRQNRERMHQSLLNTTVEATRSKLHRVIATPGLVTEAWIAEESRINGSADAMEGFKALAAYVLDDQGLNAACCGTDLGRHTPTLPTLLVWGDNDASVPIQTAKEAMSFLPGAKLLAMERCGHAPYLERPDLFNESVLRFLRETRREA